jgi:hypothetical protein
MQLTQRLLPDMLAVVSAPFTRSLSSLMDEVRNGLLAFLREFYATLGVPAWREFSRMFQDALRHPGTRVLNDHLVSIVLVVSLIVGAIAMMVLWRMLWTGIRVDKASFRITDQEASNGAISLRDAITGYARSLVNSLIEGVVLFWVVLVLTTVFFTFFKTLWFSYLASPLGQLYPLYFPYRAQLISMVLGQDLFIFPLVLTGIAFGTGMVFSAICRFFHLTRYIYLPKGGAGQDRPAGPAPECGGGGRRAHDLSPSSLGCRLCRHLDPYPFKLFLLFSMHKSFST